MMNFENAVFKIIQNCDWSDQQKRFLICKIIDHSTTQNVSFQECSSLFNSCLKMAIENSSYPNLIMSLFAFSTWGEKYPNYLKEYLSLEQLTQVFAEDDPNHLTIILTWLNQVLKILMVDPDFDSLMCPVLSDVLHSKLEDCGKSSTCLSKLTEVYIQYPLLLPQPNLCTNFIISIMKCVAAFQTPTKPETVNHMKNIGTLINYLWETLKLEDILETLIFMYSIISNPDKSAEVCPAMAHLLSLVNAQVVEKLGPRIVLNPQYQNITFVATLNRLSTWLVAWPTAHDTLIHWIETLVKLLYQHGDRHSVPAKVTYGQIPKLLEALRIPICRQGVMMVVTIFLMSFQYSHIAFHKVIPQFVSLIRCLENESSDSAKKTLEQVVLLCHGQMNLFPGHPEIYQPLMDALSKHQAPSDSEVQQIIQKFAWTERFRESGNKNLFAPKGLSSLLGNYGAESNQKSLHKRQLNEKVGLRNLGNTCYMNSVIQALFMTDDFRRSVLHMSPKGSQHLLVKLQKIFSLLCFSHRSHIAPKIFHDKSRPSWFSPGMQQDCSEYLRHLMITLHEEEREGQKLPDYQERVIIESETASLASDVQAMPDDCASVIEDDLANYELMSDSLPSRIQQLPDSKSLMKSESLTDSNSEIFDPNFDEVLGLSSNSHGLEMESPGSDFDSLVISTKRKHISPMTSLTSQSTKVSRAEPSSPLDRPEVDNSSDSGISGDIAEDHAMLQSSSSALSSKGDSCLPNNKGLYLEDYESNSDYFISQVHKVFGGKISTCIKCLNCKTESIHKDTFTDINLTFQDSHQCNASTLIKKEFDSVSKTKNEDCKSELKIEDMIASYFTSERLTGDNQYACEKCDCKQDAERSIQILESPEHLILTQLRFYYDTSKMQRQKVFTNVEFGEHLLLPIRKPFGNLKDTKESNCTSQKLVDPHLCSNDDGKPKISMDMLRLQSPPLSSDDEVQYDCYSLYGVIVHSGHSSEGGHYYCYARNSSVAALSDTAKEKLGDLGAWYNFNDETVSKTSFSNISHLTKTFSRDTAYILFYRKVVPPTMSPLKLISEEFSSLHLELRDAVDRDNLQYEYEQKSQLNRKTYSINPHQSRKDTDKDDGPPPSSGGCGGGEGMNISSRVVF